jgi:hypothetical protein
MLEYWNNGIMGNRMRNSELILFVVFFGFIVLLGLTQ